MSGSIASHGNNEHDDDGFEGEKPRINWLVVIAIVAAVLSLAIFPVMSVFNHSAPAATAAPTQVVQTAPAQPTANPRFVSDILDCPTRVRLQPNETISVAIPERTTMDFSPAATDGDVQVCSINDPSACVDAGHSNLSGSINGVTVKNLRDHEIQFSCSYRSTDQDASDATQDDSSSDEPVEIIRIVP